MGDKLSSIGGRMGRARNRQISAGSGDKKQFAGAFKNAKTRGAYQKANYSGSFKNEQRRKASEA